MLLPAFITKQIKASLKEITSYITKVLLLLFILSIPNKAQAQQSTLDRLLLQKNLEKQQEKLFKKPVRKDRFYFKGKSKRDGKYCIKVEKIEFEGSTKLSKKDQLNLTRELMSQCIYNDQIANLVNKITNNYIAKGYINARAYFKAYNSKNKTLTLKIAEGRINSIILNNIKKNQDPKKHPDKNSFFDKSQILFAFPTSKGEIFHIDDIERGTEQMNRLRSNNVVVDSRPSEIEGMSDLIINNYKNDNSLETSINYDNSGSKSTGMYNTTYGINQDILLLLDNLGVQYFF